MSYSALRAMQKKNLTDYGISGTAKIPPIPRTKRNYGREALRFIRENCEDLNFDTEDDSRIALDDNDGKSSEPSLIPYNMERDTDRLCLETAAARFLATGTREDAFDLYFCYCEIFKPFGSGYDTTGLLLKLLSEHETNASSLLMKHRDHYSHSVYVFLIGLAIYRCHGAFRKAYNDRYHLGEGKEAAAHFLKYWGMTSLFHDIGYPFEIAHQQMKTYICKLDGIKGDDGDFAPHVSYRCIEQFTDSPLGDMNDLYTRVITERLGAYLRRTGKDAGQAEDILLRSLKDRAVHANPNGTDYKYMDHAYFSGMLMMRTYLERHRDISSPDMIDEPVMDSFCSIILHNSLFKFTFRNMLDTAEPLSLSDGQPLAYLLMLCDELQCWDRASYGQNSRSGIFAFDFDMRFTDDGGMLWTYYFDRAYSDKVKSSKAYSNMLSDGYYKKSRQTERKGRSKFVDDIDEIISLKDVIPAFEPDVGKVYTTKVIVPDTGEEKKKRTGLYLSDSNYLNLYDFALVLNGRYCGAETEDAMREVFDHGLSLEYKLSNIAQAKGFARRLDSIGCFYTDRAVDYEPVRGFTDDELLIIAEGEHDRWCAEKTGMGWQSGCGHLKAEGKEQKIMRERTRIHHDLVPFDRLPDKEAIKDRAAMEKMLELIKEFEGLTIYRMKPGKPARRKKTITR